MSTIQEFEREPVYVDVDPGDKASLCLRSKLTGEMLATGGKVDSYGLSQSPDGSITGSFSYTGFRKVPQELAVVQGMLDIGDVVAFTFFGYTCYLRKGYRNDLALEMQLPHVHIFHDVGSISWESTTKNLNEQVSLRGVEITLASGGKIGPIHDAVIFEGQLYSLKDPEYP